jgi:hypothetical protein
MFTAPARREFLTRAVAVPHWGWFLLLTGVLVFTTLGVSVWWPYHREQDVIRRVEALGGRVEVDSIAPWWLRKHLDKERFQCMGVFDRVWLVKLDRTSVDDSDLTSLSGLADPFGLSLRETRITDAGLEHLGRMPNVVTLFLEGTAISDAGMERVSRLTNLIMLSLDHTRVTERGLVHVAHLSTLIELSLNHTHTNDMGLRQLAGMSGLRLVEVRDTDVTDAGVAELKRALPHLGIDH